MSLVIAKHRLVNQSIQGTGAHNKHLKIIGKFFNLMALGVSFRNQISSQVLAIFDAFMIL